MRTLGQSRRILVAAPALATSIGNAAIADLATLPTLSSTDELGEIEWHLVGPNDARHTVRHQPRMTCGDFDALRDAAAGGLGVALLPDHVCGDDLRAGRLVRVFPCWGGQMGIVHLVFTTRRGQRPPCGRSSTMWRGRSRGEIGGLALAFSNTSPMGSGCSLRRAENL